MLRRVSEAFLVTSRWFADLSLGVLLIGALVTLAVVDERRPVAARVSAVPSVGRAIALIETPETPVVAVTRNAHPTSELPDPGRLADFANWPAGEPLDIASEQPEVLEVSAVVEPPLASPLEKARRNTGNIVSLKTYRTLCVRTCDGFFWQMSYAVPKSAFGVDSNACHASCSGETKLYASENGAGGSQFEMASAMPDADGELYSKLPNANRFRKEFMPSCGCGAQPWDPASLARHANYAKLARAGTLSATLDAADTSRREKLNQVPAQVVALNGPGGISKPRFLKREMKRGKRKSIITTKIVVSGKSLIQVLGLNASSPETTNKRKKAASAKIVHAQASGSIIQLLNAKR